MATCEQCGNDYDKSFAVTLGGRTHDLRQLRVRDPGASTDMPQLRQPHHRAWRGAQRQHLLLRTLAKQEGVTGLRDRD
jgi:hypothetical protein